MAKEHIPGLAFAVVRDGRVVEMRTIGFRDLEKKLPVTPDTLFPIGSCTKAFTSMAMALSADRGLLTLDDPPRRYLPYLRLADPEADAKLTIRDMLSHRSGLRAYADLAAEPGVLTREEYVRAATSAKPAVPFRTKFQYSNAMYSAAGEIIGRVNDSTWEEVVARDIFAPLGMRRSVSVIDRMRDTIDHVTGYEWRGGAATPVPPPKSLVALAPGGAIASSARDMTLWLTMLSEGGRIDGRAFVSPAMFRELTTPQIAVSPTIQYALGWAVYDVNGMRVVEHNGGSSGISALVSFIPEKHAGLVILANTRAQALTRVGNAGKTFWPLILGIAPPATSVSKDSPAPPPAPSAAQPATIPAIDALVARMIDAAGGERALRAHTSYELHARKSYEYHGVTAGVTVQAKAPNLHNETEVWSAAGREIAHFRIWFDGARGAQETTFGQDETNDAAANERASRDYAFHRLLDLRRLYPAMTVTSDDAGNYVVALNASQRLIVDAATARVVRRESEGESETFDDFRLIDGELVPFRRTLEDSLGTATTVVDSIRFNVPLDDSLFQPRSASVAR